MNTSVDRPFIRWLYTQTEADVSAIAEKTGQSKVVIERIIKEEGLTKLAPATEDATVGEQLARLESSRQLAFAPTYALLESMILRRLSDLVNQEGDDALTAEGISKVVSAFKTLRTTGIPQQTLEQLGGSAGGLVVQIVSNS